MENFMFCSRPQSSSSTSPSLEHHLLTLLERHQPFMQLRASLEQITALAQDLTALLPAYLAAHVSPGLLQDGRLTLFTPHSACAARLRHLAPSITQVLQQRGWLVQTLKIRIRAHLANLTNTPPATKEAHLSATGFTQLRTLSEQLEPSPLQTAITQMVERHASHF